MDIAVADFVRTGSIIRQRFLWRQGVCRNFFGNVFILGFDGFFDNFVKGGGFLG